MLINSLQLLMKYVNQLLAITREILSPLLVFVFINDLDNIRRSYARQKYVHKLFA